MTYYTQNMHKTMYIITAMCMQAGITLCSDTHTMIRNINLAPTLKTLICK